MTGMPPWEVVGPLLIAVAAVITAIGSLTKVLAEVRAMRVEQGVIREQVQNSHGTNLREDMDVIRDEMRGGFAALDRRVTAMHDEVVVLRGEVVEVRDDARVISRRQDRELARLQDGQLGLTGTLAEGLSQLHDADAEDRRRADSEYRRIWRAIEQPSEES